MQDLRKLQFLEHFLKKCSQMLSQYFIEYFWAYTFLIVLTYISTPTVLEGLQISRNHCINPFWSVTVHWQAIGNSCKLYFVKVLTVI